MGLLDEIFGGMPQIDPQQLAMTTRRAAPPPARMPALAPAPAAAPRPDFGGGVEGSEFLGAILQGLGGVAAPVGQLVAGQGARERQNKQRGEVYDWLLTQKDPNDNSRTITPDMAKIIVTNEAIAKEYLPRILGTGKATVEAATKGAPTGYVWNDPNDPSKGVAKMQGYEAKPDPIETAMAKEEFKADTKQMGELRKEGNVGRDTLDKLARLRKAREQVSYEGGIGADTRTWLGKNLPDILPFGIPGMTLVPDQAEAGKAEEITSLATDIQLDFTQKTKGAISNREMELFGTATPGMTMSDAGAKGVMDGFEAGALRMREKPKFFEAWRRANGSLEGADDAWDSFIDERPILQDDGRGGFTVDRSNVGAWKEFVRSSKGGDPISAPASASPRPDGARQAPDGNFYLPDPNRPGKYLRVVE